MSAGPHGNLAPGATRWLTAVAGGLCLSLAAAACSASAGSSPQRSAASRTSAATPSPAPSRPLTLQVTRAAYRLPSAISRAVVLARGQDLLIIGGITQALTTTGAIIQLNPATGRAAPAGQLATPAHDAAGAVLGGRPLPLRRWRSGGTRRRPGAAAQRYRRRDRPPPRAALRHLFGDPGRHRLPRRRLQRSQLGPHRARHRERPGLHEGGNLAAAGPVRGSGGAGTGSGCSAA